MSMFQKSFKWVMLICGLLTCAMFSAVWSPEAAMQSTFGESITTPAQQLVVKHWGASVGLVGAMLIYGAFRDHVRPMVLLVAIASKLLFVVLVLSQGQQFLQFQAKSGVVIDTAMVLLFAAYLISSKQKAAA